MKILSFLPLACFADEVVDYSGYKVNGYLIIMIRLNSEKFQNFMGHDENRQIQGNLENHV